MKTEDHSTEPAEQLASFVVQTSYDDLPPKVVDYVKKSILDTLSVSIAGSSQQGIPEIVDLVKSWGGTEESTILVHGGRVPAPNAAFANGPMARALDMGDVHEEAGHVTEYILPAVLPAAELRAGRGRPVTGKEFITAYAVGGEVLCRIGLACSAVSHSGGKHPQMGTFGSAAAVAKLLDLDQDQTWNALGIAMSSSAFLDAQIAVEGTLMVRGHHAYVCRDGLLGVLLTERGITGVRRIFTGERNFFSVHYPHGDCARLTEGLGTTWEFAKGTMMKPYMCCKLIHTPIHAARSIVEENAIDVAAIEKIDIRTDSLFTWDPHEVRYNPQNVVDCQFSGPWAVASATIDGHLFIDSYEDLFRGDVRALMEKITAATDSTLPRWAALATIFANGKEYTKRIEHVPGHPLNPFTWDDLSARLKKCAAYSAVPIPEANLNRLAATVHALEEVEDVGEIISLITA